MTRLIARDQPAERMQQLRPGPCPVILSDQQEKPVLLAVRKAGDVRGQRVRIVLVGRPGRTGLGRDSQQMRVQTQEVGERALRRSKRLQARGNRRFPRS